MTQLTVNLAGILIAGVTTLYIQRRLYRRRRSAHLQDGAREAAGLPLGHRRGHAPRLESDRGGH